jgi:hypothetical protein
MAIYRVTVNLNRRPDAGYFIYGYRSGDPVEPIGDYVVEAKDTNAAAERIFEFGNLRETEDLRGQVYPGYERSISKGDVLVIAGEKGIDTLACASFGWKYLTETLKTVNTSPNRV